MSPSKYTKVNNHWQDFTALDNEDNTRPFLRVSTLRFTQMWPYLHNLPATSEIVYTLGDAIAIPLVCGDTDTWVPNGNTADSCAYTLIDPPASFISSLRLRSRIQ